MDDSKADVDGAPGGLERVQASGAFLERLTEYVSAIAPRLLFDAADPDQPLLGTIRSPTGQEILSRFIEDGRAPALYLDTFAVESPSKS